MKPKLGTFSLRTVGNVTFIEDSNGIIHVDCKWLTYATENKSASPISVAEFIVAACNAYQGSREV
jgi:hypothetical protein